MVAGRPRQVGTSALAGAVVTAAVRPSDISATGRRRFMAWAPRTGRPSRTKDAAAGHRVRPTRVGRMPGVPPARYAYLGPEGTFAEAAVRTIPAASRGDLQPHTSVTDRPGGGPPRRGRPRAGADRELGRGLGVGNPGRARGRRPADGDPRGAAPGVVRADGASGHGLARRTPGSHPPARGGPVPALARDGAADAVVVPALVDGRGGGRAGRRQRRS